MTMRLGGVAPAGAIVVMACFALGVTLFTTAAAGAGAAPVALQPYEDPDKQFTISYPQGWHVKQFPAGGTSFYLDDPEEGTSFSFRPAGTLKGEMNAAQVLNTIVTEIRKKYPDFKVVGQKMRPMTANRDGSIVDVSGIWTNAKKVGMKGWATLGVIKQIGKGRTVFSYLGYQAPSKDFDQVEPVFDRMIRSLKIGKAK